MYPPSVPWGDCALTELQARRLRNHLCDMGRRLLSGTFEPGGKSVVMRVVTKSLSRKLNLCKLLLLKRLVSAEGIEPSTY